MNAYSHPVARNSFLYREDWQVELSSMRSDGYTGVTNSDIKLNDIRTVNAIKKGWNKDYIILKIAFSLWKSNF